MMKLTITLEDDYDLEVTVNNGNTSVKLSSSGDLPCGFSDKTYWRKTENTLHAKKVIEPFAGIVKQLKQFVEEVRR